MEVTSEKCEWCNGSGVDSEGVAIGNPYPCTECRGTGFKYGHEGFLKDLKEMDEAEKDLDI